MPSNTDSTHRFIGEMQPGERIEDQIFLLASKDLRTTSNGALYIHVVLADRTGQVPARLWQATEEQYQQMPEGGFLRFKGRTESYKGSLQFIIEGMRAVNTSEVTLADFMPATSEDVEAMWARVKEILRTVKNRDLLMLVKQFVDDEKLVAQFKRAPAAIQLHHAYLGGLLEHTRNVLELALVVTPRYPKVSLDLVLVGIFLHDLGKTTELCYETNFCYGEQGQLVGHIVQAAFWVEQRCQAVAEATSKPFPEDIKTSLQHIIVSHHGRYEFGSPKLPSTPEAILVHHLDNIDAKLHLYLREIEKDDNPDNPFTDYVRSLETKIYKKDVMGIRG
ncbi:MAG: HD domain-containing protein [Phycisphaerae bacterium]|nr:HD domain-containing protein [Phycisphaerae bacterium]